MFVDCWEPPPNSRMSSIIPLGKLFGGKSVRLTPPMGPIDERNLSIRDIILVVSDTDYKNASKVWARINSDETSDELLPFC